MSHRESGASGSIKEGTGYAPALDKGLEYMSVQELLGETLMTESVLAYILKILCNESIVFP